jgi:D-3-phosphoglycerate dehydrogenase
MRILLADSNHEVLEETLTMAGFDCELGWKKSIEEVLIALPHYEGLIIRSRFRITKELLDKCPKLKCIGRVGAGMENIDVAAANEKGIVCLCVPEGNRDAVGEHATGMLLMLLNHLKRADNEVRSGIWKRAENRGHELGHMTVAIMGYGNMGSAFAQKLSGFGCKILVYDKYKKGFGNGFVVESTMEEIFENADVLSLHLPLTEETKYIFDKKLLNSFRKSIYVINTARGPCVNTADLAEGIQAGKVLGACLDVLEYESVSFERMDLADSPKPLKFILESEKVLLSPHIAGWTHESNYKMSRLIAEKMIGVLTKN